jgi:hypothetical protein
LKRAIIDISCAARESIPFSLALYQGDILLKWSATPAVNSHTPSEQGMKESNLGPLDHQMKALPPVFYVYIYQTNSIDTG